TGARMMITGPILFFTIIVPFVFIGGVWARRIFVPRVSKPEPGYGAFVLLTCYMSVFQMSLMAYSVLRHGCIGSVTFVVLFGLAFLWWFIALASIYWAPMRLTAFTFAYVCGFPIYFFLVFLASEEEWPQLSNAAQVTLFFSGWTALLALGIYTLKKLP